MPQVSTHLFFLQNFAIIIIPFFMYMASDFDILVANGIYIHQVHFEGNSSDTILTNQSGNAVGIDFHFE